MICPRCSTPLYEETLDGKRRQSGGAPYRTAPNPVDARDLASLIWIDRCPGCKGIWFDSGEIARAMRSMQIVDAPDPPTNLQSTPREPCACPVCQETMSRVQSRVIQGLLYDRCKTCRGVWLDTGEVYHLADPLVALSAFVISEFSR
jgi:Zn-finger nucleic acid-binding protein